MELIDCISAQPKNSCLWDLQSPFVLMLWRKTQSCFLIAIDCFFNFTGSNKVSTDTFLFAQKIEITTICVDSIWAQEPISSVLEHAQKVKLNGNTSFEVYKKFIFCREWKKKLRRSDQFMFTSLFANEKASEQRFIFMVVLCLVLFFSRSVDGVLTRSYQIPRTINLGVHFQGLLSTAINIVFHEGSRLCGPN